MRRGLQFERFWHWAKLPVAVLAAALSLAPFAFGIAPTKRPSYCPLPEDVTFDKTQHPELIGLYTGKWVPDDSM